jgi:hypothetical protein
MERPPFLIRRTNLAEHDRAVKRGSGANVTGSGIRLASPPTEQPRMFGPRGNLQAKLFQRDRHLAEAGGGAVARERLVAP